MASTTKKDGFLFPGITDLKSAQKVGRQGAIVCVLIILSVVVGNFATSTTGKILEYHYWRSHLCTTHDFNLYDV